MKRTFTLICMLGALFVADSAKAQGRIGFYGAGAYPIGTFADNKYPNGKGGGIAFFSGDLINGTDVSFHAGINFDYEYFGRKSFRASMAAPYIGYGDVHVRNESFNMSAAGRFVFGQDKIQPYAELFAGVRWHSTTQAIKTDMVPSDPNVSRESSEQLVNNATFAPGLGLGVQYELADWCWFDLGVDWSNGGKMKYMVPAEVTQPVNELDYSKSYHYSNTNMFIVKFGFWFTLEKEDDRYNDHMPEYHDRPSGTSVPSPQPKVTPKIKTTPKVNY